MKQIICFLAVFKLCTFSSAAQLRIEPFLGYNIDLKSGNYSFSQINTGVQLSTQITSDCSWLFKIERGWGSSQTSLDSSFTLNPTLPVMSNAQKTIQPFSWSFATGLRLKLAGEASPNALSALMFLGFNYQKMTVNYKYSKSDYVILNPDKTQERLGPFASGGLEYMRRLSKGSIFVQAIVSTAPAGKKSKYPSSYEFMTPLSFSTGYSIPLSKNKSHGK
jgi:hypothetical protein